MPSLLAASLPLQRQCSSQAEQPAKQKESRHRSRSFHNRLEASTPKNHNNIDSISNLTLNSERLDSVNLPEDDKHPPTAFPGTSVKLSRRRSSTASIRIFQRKGATLRLPFCPFDPQPTVLAQGWSQITAHQSLPAPHIYYQGIDPATLPQSQEHKYLDCTSVNVQESEAIHVISDNMSEINRTVKFHSLSPEGMQEKHLRHQSSALSSERSHTPSTSSCNSDGLLMKKNHGQTTSTDSRDRNVKFCTSSSSHVRFRPEVFGSGNESDQEVILDSCMPFEGGIIENEGNRQKKVELPVQMALKMSWPLDIKGYNETRKALGSKESLFGGPSLVFYHKYLHIQNVEDMKHDGVRLLRPSDVDPGSLGKIMFHVKCEAPCWSTVSKRYEAPIKVGAGRNGPLLWEARPSPPKDGKRKQSTWKVVNSDGTMASRARFEDIEETKVHVNGPENISFQVHAMQDTTIKLEYKDEEIDVAQHDIDDAQGVLHMDTRPYGTPFRRRASQAIDAAFLIVIFETAQAMRDESVGAGRGRRDEYGRLSFSKRNVLVKTFSRSVL